MQGVAGVGTVGAERFVVGEQGLIDSSHYGWMHDKQFNKRWQEEFGLWTQRGVHSF